jgi:hypothetical protein
MAEEKKDKKASKKIGAGKLVLIMLGIGLAIFAWGSMSRKKEASSGRTTMVVSQNLDYGVLTATVGGTTMDVDPDAYITVEPLDVGVAWERIVNGIVVKRYRKDGTFDPTVTPGPVGRRDAVIYRVIEGQGVDTMKFAYVKHRNEKPPLGWFAAAKKLL